jgi:hypothetical protein
MFGVGLNALGGVEKNPAGGIYFLEIVSAALLRINAAIIRYVTFDVYSERCF